MLIKCEAVGGATNLLVILRGVHSFKGKVEYRRRGKKREKKKKNTLGGRELYIAIRGSSEDTDGCGECHTAINWGSMTRACVLYSFFASLI